MFDELGFDPELALARKSMLTFVKHMKPNYEVNWHHKYICDRIDDFANGKIKRLMLFVPPQHGKSELTSRLLPAFLLGRNPNTKVVLSSYSASLAESFNTDCQRYIDSEEYKLLFPKTTLSPINAGSMYKRNSERMDIVNYSGYLKTVGVGGSLTGTPADFLIIDDPVKDAMEASSPIIQQRNWDWYISVAETRTHNKSGILIIQTRWDTEDLSGKILQSMGDAIKDVGIEEANKAGQVFTVITIPAIKIDDSNPDDPRKIGEALWPEKHSLEKLRGMQRKTPRWFASLYQQDPKPVQVGGECYDDFKTEYTVTKCEYNPNEVLHVSFDFNVNPYMTACIAQITKTDSGKYILKQIAELCLKSPKNTTRRVCQEICKLYKEHKSGMFVYGDPSGMKEDTRGEQGHNDYSIAMFELKQFKPQLRVFKKAPSVIMRIQFMNAIFRSDVADIEYFIDENCVKTIEDFMYVKKDSDGTKFKQKGTDPSTGIVSEKVGHTSDCIEYLITYSFYNQYMRFQSGGKPLLIKVGARKTNWDDKDHLDKRHKNSY